MKAGVVIQIARPEIEGYIYGNSDLILGSPRNISLKWRGM